MRVVFMGTPEFAVPSLRALAVTHDIVAVYTQPDRPRGRGREPAPCAVKSAATEMGLPVVQPDSVRDDDELARLVVLAPEIVVVAAYGKVLPASFLAVPRHGCVNVHASLLPAHRGAAPIQRAILQGDATTGVSIMRMVEELDAGPVAAQATIELDEMYAGELTTALAELGVPLLIDVLEDVACGTVEWVEQDSSAATYASKVTPADVMLEPSLSATDGMRRVRASTSSAPCRLRVDGRLLTMVRATVSQADAGAPGSVAQADELLIALADGALRLDRIVPEGRREMSGSDWLRGARLPAGATWSAP